MFFNLVFILFSFLNQSPGKVLVIGDSITKDGRYVALLKEHCRCEIDSYGFVGYSTTKIRHEFEKIYLRKYRMVIIQMGVNNIYDPKTVKLDFEVMINMAHQNEVKVVVLTIPPFRGYPSWTAQKQKNVMEVNNWLLTRPFSIHAAVNIYSPLQDGGWAKHSSDGLHPNKKGHEIIAEKIYNQVTFN